MRLFDTTSAAAATEWLWTKAQTVTMRMDFMGLFNLPNPER